MFEKNWVVVSTIISAGSILWGIYKGYAARSHLVKYIPKNVPTVVSLSAVSDTGPAEA